MMMSQYIIDKSDDIFRQYMMDDNCKNLQISFDTIGIVRKC